MAICILTKHSASLCILLYLYHASLVSAVPGIVRYWIFKSSVADPHHFDPDPNPACHFDADPDPAYHFNADLDPAYHVGADPDPDPEPTFQFDAN